MALRSSWQDSTERVCSSKLTANILSLRTTLCRGGMSLTSKYLLRRERPCMESAGGLITHFNHHGSTFFGVLYCPFEQTNYHRLTKLSGKSNWPATAW